MKVNNKAKTTESVYMVLKPMKWRNKRYHPPRANSQGIIEYDVVKLPNWAAGLFYWAGIITDDLPIIRGKKTFHPLDKDAQLKKQQEDIYKKIMNIKTVEGYALA